MLRSHYACEGDKRVKDENGNEWIPGTQVSNICYLHSRDQMERGDLQFE